VHFLAQKLPSRRRVLTLSEGDVNANVCQSLPLPFCPQSFLIYDEGKGVFLGLVLRMVDLG